MTDVPSGLLPEGLSIALVVLFSLALGALALGAIWKTLRERRLAREAESYVSPSVLTPGDVVLRGVIASDATWPLVLDVHQEGREWNRKGELHHRWQEVRRELRVQPFELVLDRGERVRVLPMARARLIGVLLQTRRSEKGRRVMTVRIRTGDTVHIEGALSHSADSAAPYRGNDDTWTLAESSSAPLTVFGEPRAAQHQRRAGHWLGVAIGTSVLFFLTQWVFAVIFWPLILYGVRCEAEIDHISLERAARNGDSALHLTTAHVVRSEGDAIPVGTRLVASVTHNGWRPLAVGDHLPFVVSPTDHSDIVLGSHSGLSPFTPIAWTFLGTLLLLFLYQRHQDARDWHERKPVIHRGRGGL